MRDGTSSESGDFFASLLRDHALIETRLASLARAASTVSDAASDADALGVLIETLRFIETEGARHQALEELTLFPRLRPRPEFKQILSALEFQHRMNDAEGQQLAAFAARFASGNGRELRRLAFRFVEMHRGHAVAEERALFPLASSVLSPEVLAEMSREMQERKRA